MSARYRVQLSIRTLRDLRIAQCRKGITMSILLLEHVDAWDALVKYAGWHDADDLTAKALRRLKIRVADHHDMAFFRLGSKTLPEFVEMCDAAIPHAAPKPRTPRQSRRRYYCSGRGESNIPSPWPIIGVPEPESRILRE